MRGTFAFPLSRRPGREAAGAPQWIAGCHFSLCSDVECPFAVWWKCRACEKVQPRRGWWRSGQRLRCERCAGSGRPFGSKVGCSETRASFKNNSPREARDGKDGSHSCQLVNSWPTERSSSGRCASTAPEGWEQGSKQAAKSKGRLPRKTSVLDLRVGVVLRARLHPNADDMYVEDVDVGADAPRTISTHFPKFYTLEELPQKRVIVLCNMVREVFANATLPGLCLTP